MIDKALGEQLLKPVMHAAWSPSLKGLDYFSGESLVKDAVKARTRGTGGLMLVLTARGRGWLNAWMKSKADKRGKVVHGTRKSLLAWVGGKEATLAIVYTDIVRSTALANRLGDEPMKQIRKRHFRQVRALVKAYDGWEIKNKGDGFILVFRTAVSALKAVLALKENPGHADIRIRAGVHLGLVEVDPTENDTFGRDMNFAARIEGQAGNSICLSSDAMSQISAHRAEELRAVRWDKRRVPLKGFDGTHCVHVLR
jgi:class 3 adenylate cyclase